MFRKTAVLLAFALALTGGDPSPVPARALNAITPAGLLKHISVLASDEFDGRAPDANGVGEKKSVEYIVSQAKALKLEPGNPDGSWLQNVTLWGILSGGGEISVKAGGAEFPLVATDYRVASSRPSASTDVPESPIVFVGYGIVAPEYQWDDYKGIDVKGEAVAYLAGDPPIPDPNDPAKLDPKMFLGPELSFYGRPGTKADLAFARGATAVISIAAGGAGGARAAARGGAARGGGARGGNEAGRAGATPRVSLAPRESMILRDAWSSSRIAATVTLNGNKPAELFAAGGQDLAALRKAALGRDFKPVPLSASLAVHAHNTVREVTSANVVAKITGSDPSLRNEYVIYSGHWDHLGHVGENIYHGASDNASGTAGVLELARAFTQLPARPKRTVVFLWTTAEERGLLGAKYYVQNPLYPLAKTAANINLDYFSNWGWGKTKDFSILGIGMSSLDDLVRDVVTRQGRVVTGDTDPAEGFYWRSDHVEFAMGGVPSLATSPGIDFVGEQADFGNLKRTEYIRDDYHRPSDQVKPDWDLTGAVEDLQVLLEVGYRAAQEPKRPVWRERGPYMVNPHAGR